MKRSGSTDGIRDADKSARPLEMDDLATQTIDVADLFTKDVTVSGSFDVRGSIWATTFGKLLQALPIPVMLVDHSYKVAAANEAWGRISQAYKTLLNIRFSELFAAPSNARKIQSIAEEVFGTRRAKVVEAPIKVGKAREIWGRITFRSIRIMQDRFLVVLVEDLTVEKKQLALNKRIREELEGAHGELEKKVKERTAQLFQTNESLREEVEQRRKAEETLKAVVEAIGQQLRNLREELELQMRLSLQPLVDVLKAEVSPEGRSLLIQALDNHLQNLFSSLGVKTLSKLTILTPRQMLVCNLIVSGLSSKQIASVMQVTSEAVNAQKRFVRKKLGLKLSSESIDTWLRALGGFQDDQL